MKVIAYIRSLLGTVAALGLLAMMFLMFIDVLGRKFLSQPVLGSVEIGELLMLVTIYAAMPLVSDNQEHVHLDLVDNLVPASLQNAQARLGEAVCGLLLLGGSWITLTRAWRTEESSDATTLLQIPLAPFHYAVAGLLLVTALVHLYFAFLATGKSDELQQLEI